MPLWSGRFKDELNDAVWSFNSSIGFDKRLWAYDIRGSLAHVEMLAACGIICREDATAITGGLNGILEDIKTGRLEIDAKAEDIHTFIEEELCRRIGEAGKRLHTGRSRNDQTVTDLRMYLRDEAAEVRKLLKHLLQILCKKAGEHAGTIMPGYTHLQRGQPVTFGHYLMAYAQMFLRDIGRLEDAARRMNESPLGSGALAGVTYPLDREMTARLLQFDKPCENSMDGVSDRDFCLELLSAVSIIMTHLSRFCEEIILFASWEFKFLELDDAFSTGSSIMPQKKNPDIAELVRGKTGRVLGSLMGTFSLLKALPMAYNKDMQEDKEAVFDAFDTVKACLSAFTSMLDTAVVQKETMRAAASKGFINATDCADYLTRKGMPFRDAYRVTGELVTFCMENNHVLETLPLAEYRRHNEMFEDDIYEAINLDTCVAKRKSHGGPARDEVLRQVEFVKWSVGNLGA